jgi:hypothetical protein
MEMPQVNRLSGTHPPDLIEAYTIAMEAVQVAINCTGACWPNGRDYQGGSIRQAMHEHAERIKHLRQVAAELETIAESISNQIVDQAE